MVQLQTSFSEIADFVQGDIEKGKDLLVKLIVAYNDSNAEVKDLIEKAELAEASKNTYKSAVERVLKHLNLKIPIGITFDKGLFVISDTAITFEANII